MLHRCLLVCLTLTSLASAQRNWAAHAAGGAVVEAPESLSAAHRSRLLIDGDPDGPPFESLPGARGPLRIALRFEDGRPVLVERVRIVYGGVDPDRRPTAISLSGSPFGDALGLLSFGPVAPGRTSAEHRFAEPVPLRYLVLDFEVAGENLGLGEIEVWGREEPESLGLSADEAVEVALALPCRADGLEAALLEQARGGEGGLSAFDAGLIASGVTDSERLEAYRAGIAVLASRLTIPGVDARSRGDALLRWLHEELFGSYEAADADVRKALNGESFQCISATLVYGELARRKGLEARAVETGDHVFSQVKVGEEWLDVETTTAGGFAPDPDAILRLREQRGIAAGLQGRRVLPAFGLAAAIYHNRAYDAHAAGDFRVAIDNAVKSLTLDPGSRVTLHVLLATFNDWAGQLAGRGAYGDALTVIGRGRSIAPDDLALLCQELAIYGMWTSELGLTGGADRAIAVLAEALEEPRPGAPVLRYFLGGLQAERAWAHFADSSGRALPEVLRALAGAERENPAVEETLVRVLSTWAEAPLHALPDRPGREQLRTAREASLRRYTDLADLTAEELAPTLRALVAGRVLAWAGEELAGADRLSSRGTVAHLRAALVLYDAGLALTGPHAGLRGARDTLVARVQEELRSDRTGAIWPALELLREPGDVPERLNPAQLSLLVGWAQAGWEPARALVDFAPLDTDGNGELSAEELLGDRWPPFRQLDGDANGRVGPAEAQAYRAHVGEQCAARFAEAAERFPDDPELRQVRRAFVLELARSAADGDPLAVARQLDEAATDDPASGLLETSRDHELARWVREPLADGDHALAAARLSDALRRFPHAGGLAALASELYLAWAEVELAAGRGYAALRKLEQGLAEAPGDEALFARRHSLFFQLAESVAADDPRAAAEIYSQALAAEPEEQAFAFNRAVYLSRWAELPYADGDLGKSVGRYEELLTENPDDATLHQAAVRFFDLAAREPMAAEAWDAAIAIYERGLELIPDAALLTRNRDYCRARRED